MRIGIGDELTKRKETNKKVNHHAEAVSLSW